MDEMFIKNDRELFVKCKKLCFLAFSPLPTMFSKAFLNRVVKTPDRVGERLQEIRKPE